METTQSRSKNEVEELNDANRAALGLEPDHQGMVIVDVDPATEAARAGLAEGDLIAEIDQEPVNTLAEARRRLLRAGNIVVLRVFSGTDDRYVALRLR